MLLLLLVSAVANLTWQRKVDRRLQNLERSISILLAKSKADIQNEREFWKAIGALLDVAPRR